MRWDITLGGERGKKGRAGEDQYLGKDGASLREDAKWTYEFQLPSSQGRTAGLEGTSWIIVADERCSRETSDELKVCDCSQEIGVLRAVDKALVSFLCRP